MKFRAVIPALALCACVSSASAGPIQDIYDKCMAGFRGINNAIISGCAEKASDAASTLLSRMQSNFLEEGGRTQSKNRDGIDQALARLNDRWKSLMDEQCAIESSWIGMPAADICRVRFLDMQVERYEFLLREGDAAGVY